MGSAESHQVEAKRTLHNDVDPRSPCPQINRTPLQVMSDRNDPRSPSDNVMRTPIDKSSGPLSPESCGENRPLLKQCLQAEKKSLIKEFIN